MFERQGRLLLYIHVCAINLLLYKIYDGDEYILNEREYNGMYISYVRMNVFCYV